MVFCARLRDSFTKEYVFTNLLSFKELIDQYFLVRYDFIPYLFF